MAHGPFTIGVPKKECLTKKGLQMTTLNFFKSYIIIIVMDCCMPIDKLTSFLIN